MASLQTEDTLPSGLRFLTLQHAYEVAKSRVKAERAGSASFDIASRSVVAAVAAEEAVPDTKSEDDGTDTESKESGLQPLHDGHQKLYSYFPPRLDGGKQTITATQTIYASSATEKQGRELKPKPTTKEFLVQAPQFSLPDGSVLSVNPAPGGLATAETLPHIIFNDPHLPWERRIEKDDATRRGRMPWLALLVFSQDELQLPSELLQGENSPFMVTSLAKDAQGKPTTIKQSSDLTMTLSGTDVEALNKQGSIISPIPQPDDSKSKATALFLKPKLFQQLVTTYEQKETTTNEGKKLVLSAPKEGQTAADISRFEYFAHVRHVKTIGMTTSAQYKDGLFSVIMSHRAGPISADQKTPAMVHLVSLEGWKNMAFPLSSAAQYVAISSLYSWTYTVLPAGGISLEAEFENLQNGIGLLRAPQALIDKMEATKNENMRAKLGKRMREGYTMQRHRTRTGEVTSSFFRAVLIPVVPREPAWTAMSRCGSDLQILDHDTGMMDITYSAAWQLGKSLAIADAAFTTALTRLWNSLHGICLDGAKREILSETNAYKSREDVLRSLKTSILTLSDLQRVSPQEGRDEQSLLQETPVARRPLTEEASLAIDDTIMLEKSEKQAKRHIRRIAGAKDENGKEYPDGQRLYNELNESVSTEWKVILGWIMDRMYLFGIPSPYLLADPSFLPQESIRFFHVDANWLDALIDGALSLGSHMGGNDDYIRRRIKGAINTYLETVDKATGYTPQIPSYGMILRSDLVSRFPDLKVEAPIPKDAPEAGRAPILRQEIIGEGLLLCLFDRIPGKDNEMPVLAFTQPPHQQTFTLGHSLTPDRLDVKYKRTYTIEKDKYDFTSTLLERTTESRYESSGYPVESGPPLFMWGAKNDARFLLTSVWAQDVVAVLRDKMPDDFIDTAMTSAVAAFQLGMPIYRFCIGETSILKSLAPDPKLPPRRKGFQLLGSMQRGSEVAVQHEGVTLTAQVLDYPLPLIALNSLDSSPPPHFQFTPTLLQTPFAASIAQTPPRAETGATTEGATGARFAYAVHAIGVPSGPLQTGQGPLDLIFTIKRSDSDFLPKDYKLKRITLKIPRGKKLDNGTVNLLDSYQGPGPTMLSNLRFNVFAEATKDTMFLRLQPRSKKALDKGVLIDRVRECGFILPLVNVHNFNRKVTVNYIEEWAKPALTIPRDFTIQLKPAGIPSR
ncbi:hypothetical protein TGAMA5MH_00371 [Trichoderma gamsii]|uniref:Uncharacterized protein n=1 Tax=Trichoderma gamsii TaxID=398673 RepID=A0A2K0TT25_9HYPO|nr:hypothetical protein TGAMA5MH_00371 [Trichoderma gamsii]